MRSFARDLHHGVRQLFKNPGFSLAAIASLALGIGLNTTLFSIVNGVLFRNTSIVRADRLVEMYSGLNKDFPQLTTSYPDYIDIRRGADALNGIAASAYVRGIMSGGTRPSLVTGEVISPDYFDVLGVRLAAGRPIRDDENRVPDQARVVVISDGLWKREFGSRPEVVGETLKLSGLQYTIIGIAPRGFSGTIPGLPADFWTPLMMVDRLQFSGVQTSADNDPGATRLERRGTRWLFLKGRLADGRTVDEARTQVNTIVARLNTDYPVTNDGVTATVLPANGIRFHPLLDGYVRAASAALLAAVGLVLLVACGNVANMLLARGASRRREIAIRTALGASRARIIGQLLSEGLVLAAAGGTLGVLMAWWASRALGGLTTNVLPVPVSFDFSIDPTVLVFALAASIATAFLFGLAPALSASRPDLVPALKASMEGDSRVRVTLSDALVVGQLSLSLVLLVVAALLTRGLISARATNLGYDPRPVSSLTFNLQMNGYDLDRATAFRKRVLETLRALPGVAAASTASRLPLAPDVNLETILVQGHHASDDDGTPVDTVRVGFDYFRAVDVPIVSGHAFTEDDLANQRKVAIVNETLARQFWPNGAVGQRVYVGAFKSEPFEIVGVSRDHKVRSVGEYPRPYLHLPEEPSRTIGLIVRTATPASSARSTLRRAIRDLDPEILFVDDASAEEVAATTIAPTRIGAMVLAAFGGLALILAAIGLYGVISYSVSRRTRELGLRMALGAERWQVLKLVLGQGSRLAIVGLALGAVGAAAISRLLESLLYGVSGFDPIAYATSAGLLLLVALAANLIPALAASRVDPIRALRTE